MAATGMVLLVQLFGIFLIQASLTANVPPVCNNQSNSPLNVKFTKSVDISVETNVDNIKPSLTDLIKSQIHENVRGITDKLTNTSDNDGSIEPEGPKVPEIENINNKSTSNTNQESILSSLNSLAKKIRDVQDNLTNFDCRSVHLTSRLDEKSLCDNLVGVSKPAICEMLEDGVKINNNLPKSCKEIQEGGQNKSGIYEIHPKKSAKPFKVFCDMETKGGGWTTIQTRYDGSQDFFKEWREYKFGFGNLKREFWLGLEHIYHITGFEVNELLVEITDRDKVTMHAQYKAFGIGPETDGYPLNVLRGFSGEAGDSLTEHLGAKFSTKDLDQDTYTGNCAQLYLGAWWYKGCHASNLNGKYINVPLSVTYKLQGLHWKTFRGHEYCHAASRMLVKPVEA